jgi:type IV pilus assembly protein PilV
MSKLRHSRDRQEGVMLIEALIAILIFSIGILAVVGMQGVAIKNVTESRSRSEAAYLAQRLLAQMWVDQNITGGANVSNVTFDNYNYTGTGSPPARLGTLSPPTGWIADVIKLPGASTWLPKVTITNPAAIPVVNPTPAASGADVKIEIFWQSPEEASLTPPPPPHSYTIMASIRV